MSLFQIASVSNDASIIALAILFVALCIRFLAHDTALTRLGLAVCLFLLVTGKPVHLVFGLLVLAAYKKLGWRRAASFSLAIGAFSFLSYLYWSHLAKPFFSRAGEGHGQNPPVQIRFIITHPISVIKVILVTLKQYGPHLFRDIIGVLGWAALPLPSWFYVAGIAFTATGLLIVFFNLKKTEVPNVITGGLAGFGLVLGVMIAGYVLWNPPAAPTITWIQGRYLLPALPLLAFIAPPVSKLGVWARIALVVSSLGCLLLSSVVTVHILNHYYFPKSKLLGNNIRTLVTEVPEDSCSASVENVLDSWLDRVVTGRAEQARNSRVLAVSENGTVLGESDPALTGTDFPYFLLPGSSRSRWRIHMWYVNSDTGVRLWLVRGNSGCSFGPELRFKPIPMPDA